MLRIFKTIYRILENKKKNESQDYVRGFNDCYELMKIGFEKSEHVNLSIENYKLRRILFEFLHFEFKFMESQFLKIRDLFLLYDEDYVVIDKIFNQITAKPQIAFSPPEAGDYEMKMQNFLLKETLFKLINHKFVFTRTQIEHITKISNSAASNNHKINELIQYLSKIEADEHWLDYDKMLQKQIELLYEIEILKQVEDNRNELLNKIELLKKKNERLEKKYKEIASIDIENTHLQTIVDLFLHRSVSNNQKRELSEFCNKGFNPLVKYSLMIDYMKKLKSDSAFQFFKLSETDKTAIRDILKSNHNKEEGVQELFNYIDFIVERDERLISTWIKKKTKNLT